MKNKVISSIKPLGFTWETNDPFLFCVHHLDHYPAGNDNFGPEASLVGRHLGQDFTLKEGWRMYHGEKVPGFPAHPHRGFETVTVVLEGYVDHSDSHGASGRYGNGDVQWMTAGSGMQHSEMFPLLNKEGANTLQLFQIWLNLPGNRKFSKPHYKMLWAEDIPVYRKKDKKGKLTEVRLIAGTLDEMKAPSPAPDSWAADGNNEVGIWLLKIEEGGSWTLPETSSEINRSLYFYKGTEINIAGVSVESYNSIDLAADQPVKIENGKKEALLLILQGKPIKEPVMQHGPFVMNSRKEIEEAYSDYQKTQFGGWPWKRHDNVHDRDAGRFAIYSDGQVEKKKER
ncbi:MAG: pirin family protein [Spirochaetales bacterium]|nr:pirin family protein [Spirochaetales bacterium]